MPNNIWQFSSEKDNQTGLPKIIPCTSSGSTNQNVNQSGFSAVVDVVNSFYWTHSKLKQADGTGREEVPSIYLKERKIKINSYVAQLLYSAGAALDSTDAIANIFNDSSPSQPVDMQKAVRDTKNLVNEYVFNSAAAKALSGTKLDLTTVQNVVNDGIDKAIDDSAFLKDQWLNMYKGLYITEPTGWNYFLPYFNNTYQTTNNSWGESSGESAGQFIIKNFTDLGQAAAGFMGDIATTFKVGSYQEKSKSYSFSQTGDSITISFPLINTGSATYTDLLRNWQLIYLLLYQNRPERVNRNIINPPVVYEAIIPGVKYMPLCYMSSISVEYRGARRKMKISIPQAKGNNFEFDTIIPEAYQISISLTGLMPESKNFMYSSINMSKQLEVEVKQKG